MAWVRRHRHEATVEKDKEVKTQLKSGSDFEALGTLIRKIIMD